MTASKLFWTLWAALLVLALVPSSEPVAFLTCLVAAMALGVIAGATLPKGKGF